MSKLGQVVESVDKYNQFVLHQVKRARTDEAFGRDLIGRPRDALARDTAGGPVDHHEEGSRMHLVIRPRLI